MNLNNFHSTTTSSIDTMQEARRIFACIIHQHQLYAIGGYQSGSEYFSSIESLYIGDDLIDIANQQWGYINGSLSTAVRGSRSAVYGDNIIVFDGWDGDGYPTDINVIDTVTNTVKTDGSLATGLSHSAVIIVNNILYGFGGFDSSGSLDEYQYISLYTFYVLYRSLI